MCAGAAGLAHAGIRYEKYWQRVSPTRIISQQLYSELRKKSNLEEELGTSLVLSDTINDQDELKTKALKANYNLGLVSTRVNLLEDLLSASEAEDRPYVFGCFFEGLLGVLVSSAGLLGVESAKRTKITH